MSEDDGANGRDGRDGTDGATPDGRDGRDGATLDGEGDGTSSDAEDPFAELDTGTEDPFAELDTGAGTSFREESADEADDLDPFEEMEVGELDEDEVWEALSAEGEVGDVDAAPLTGEGSGATAVDREEGEREEHIVDKRKYCQRCPHFTDPPTVACEHDGTEIVEVTDTDQFRVRGCPMIAEEGPQFDRG